MLSPLAAPRVSHTQGWPLETCSPPCLQSTSLAHQLVQFDLCWCSGAHTLAHPQSLQSLPQGDRDPLPHGLTPAAALKALHMHMHAGQRALPQDRGRREFNRDTGQTALVRLRAWPGPRTGQPTAYTQLALLAPAPLFSPLLFPRKSLTPLPCPTFDSSPKHPKRSPVPP